MATVILKVTERCNSSCCYCDVVRKAGGGRTMPPELLELVFARVGEYLEERRAEEVELVWHGGEPLLAGPELFRSAARLQERSCARVASSIRHGIQTNLTLFGDAFVEPFRQLGISWLGTSYDPLPGVRGPGKPCDSTWYRREFLRAVACAEEHGFEWGMIYVVTRRSLRQPMDLFLHLLNLCPSGAISLNPVLLYGKEDRELAITPDEYARFLGALFPWWWKHRERYPQVQPFAALSDAVVTGQPRLGCADSGCAFDHVNIAPDGETSQCGRSSDWGLLSYGNLRDRTLSSILHDERRQQLQRRTQVLAAGECAGCRFFPLCHGGCPLDAWAQHRDFMRRSEWCAARRSFLEATLEPMTGARFEPGSDRGAS